MDEPSRGSSGQPNGSTKTITSHEEVIGQIRAYLNNSRIKDKTAALITALDKREYSKALRVVANIDHIYEQEGLDLIKILYQHKADVRPNALERAGEKKLCALDYAKQKENANILRFLQGQHKYELRLVKTATLVQSYYRGNQARHLFAEMRFNKAKTHIQDLQQAIQEANANQDFERVVELGKIAVEVKDQLSFIKQKMKRT
jgi:uncharacterized protein YqgV (UPF0045/DUF77 family)